MMKKGGFHKLTVRDVPLRGKTVLLRADYNVPLGKDGAIADDYRIVSSIPTIKYLLAQNCRVVITSHLGRPEGAPNKKYSLAVVAESLCEYLQQTVPLVPDCIGDVVTQSVKKMKPGSVVLLENLRFHAEEEANDNGFARALAKDSTADYFVQDGFGVVHRAHASTQAITGFLPSVSGLLLERECRVITEVMDNPKHPFTAVLGGAKVSDKIDIIERFVDLADTIIIGGAMANTFLKYRGEPVGKSVREDGLGDVIERIYSRAEKKVGRDRVDDFIVLPEDVAVGKKIDKSERRVTVAVADTASDELILDIGSESIATAVSVIAKSKTVVWNGTMGYAELPQYSHGSARIALALAGRSDITSVIGGGDTADFVLGWSAEGEKSFSHVSTGGGASLELMSGKKLPGVSALLDA